MFENVHSAWEKREIIAKPRQRVTAAQHRTYELWYKNNNTSWTLREELYYRLHTTEGISVNLQEQDKSSDIEQ